MEWKALWDNQMEWKALWDNQSVKTSLEESPVKGENPEGSTTTELDNKCG